MMETTIQVGEAALNRLHIDYRLTSLSKGVLFFCEMADGTSLDLFLNRDGTSRVWKFISTDAATEIGTQLVYKTRPVSRKNRASS